MVLMLLMVLTFGVLRALFGEAATRKIGERT
jgi:hypothetical protein